MDTEEYFLLFGLALAVLALVYPGQLLTGTFCEGSHGELGIYRVSVSNGYLRVSAGTGDVFLVHEDRVLMRKVDIEYSYSNETGCYTLKVRQKGKAFLYGFVLGTVLMGAAFFYMIFMKYR